MSTEYRKSQYIIGNQVEFLQFMRSRAPLFHLSNLFFRDLHLAVIDFLHRKKVRVRQTEAELVAREVAAHLEKKSMLKKINATTWTLHNPDYSLKKNV